MKKTISIVAIAAVMVACNSNPKTDVVTNKPLPAADTTGLSQFQAWKAQHELSNTNEYNSNQPQKTVVIYKPERTTKHYAKRRSYQSGSMNSESSNTAKSSKKGWSRSAKGALIGGVGGGVLGAVINKKNRVAGGIVGGILGAGIGYGIGKHQDKKHGRY